MFASLLGCAVQSPDAFSLLPQEAQLIAFLDGAQLRQTKLWESLSDEFRSEFYNKEMYDEMKVILGINLVTDVESISVAAWMSPDFKANYAGVLRFLPNKTNNALKETLQASQTKTIGGVTFWEYQGTLISCLNEREVLFGSETGVERSLMVQKQQAKSVTENERLMSLRPKTGQFFLVADVPVMLSAGAAFFLKQANIPGMQGLDNLAGLSSITINADFYSGVDVRLMATVASEEAAEGLAHQPLLQGLTGLGSLYFLKNMDDWLTSTSKGKEWILRVAIPNGQAVDLAGDILWTLWDKKRNRSLNHPPMIDAIPTEQQVPPASLEALPL
jgi:hypothetical protein